MTDLREPSDAVVEIVDGLASLVVVESAGHQLVRVPIPAAAQRVEGPARQSLRPATLLLSGPVSLVVSFIPPTGQTLDPPWGDPTRLIVASTPAELLVRGSGSARGLTRELTLAHDVGSGVLHVSVQAAACDGDLDTGEVAEHAACHMYQ